ncbi:Hypothetical protein GSB_155335 [Giardia duodenalis]|uniref:non-specific serine/threonine protein kinase n=1 Tax=Giardia intestinalis TaxID=5741 RepID=V6TLF4_GIAIN|nr:Hypothetical protein GSB_155335 [Giardia intestinalis]
MAPETLIYNSTSPASDIWALGVIIYELTTLKRPNFLGDKEPRHVFTSGWRPDLSAVKDEFTRMILEKIFVLDPIERPTAGDIAILFQTLNISTNELSAQDPVSDESQGHISFRIAVALRLAFLGRLSYAQSLMETSRQSRDTSPRRGRRVLETI